MGNFFFFSHITFIVFLPQTLWKGSLSALPAVGAAGSGIRLGNESASIEAPFCRFQEHGTTWDHSCSPRSSSSPPVHLTFAGGIQRPLSSCTNHQQLPAHPGSSECCSPTYNNTFDIFIAFLTFILFPFFFFCSSPGKWAPPEISGDLGAAQQTPFRESGFLRTDLTQQFTGTHCTA